ncbi:MAG: hypothetical protein ACR2IN_05470 [Thermoleophilaceae bacterium]|jgi:hypothetical protein
MTVALVSRPQDEIDFWEDDLDGEAAPSVLTTPLLEVLDARAAPDASDSPDKAQFDALADELAQAALGLSSTRRAARHPAYGEILALGEVAIPWLLGRLEMPGNRPLWLRLLGTLTSFQPGAGQQTVTDAAESWLRWGRSRGAV